VLGATEAYHEPCAARIGRAAGPNCPWAGFVFVVDERKDLMPELLNGAKNAS
jgi:hypothetical protein